MTTRRDDLLVDKISTAEALFPSIDLGDIADAVRGLGLIEQTVQSAIRTAVEKGRAEGMTWQDVATALDLNSRQAAESRYGG